MFTRLFSVSVSLSLSLMAATALSQNAYADKAKSPHKSGGITVQHYNDDGSLADPAPSQGNMNHHEMHRASSHAPIGVMGDHRHSKGEWMLSYRYMRMNMEGSRNGQSALNPQDIVTTVPNRFFGTPMQPPTLRIVPLKMNMDMHMVGAMYGLSDRITLMGMTSYVAKDMEHTTFQGGMGTTVLSDFKTRSSGFGDTSIGALIGLAEHDYHSTHAGLALSLPTGSRTETGTILTPMGGQPTVRLPYAMQLGSGTFDFKPSLTYTGHTDLWSWGAQGNATIRLGENNEGYSHGDIYEATSWVAYDLSRSLSVSLRGKLRTQAAISGFDTNIRGPVQTADPDNFGGEAAYIAIGANYLFTKGALKHNRVALEWNLPVYRDLNGPQLETDSVLTLGWQRAY